MSTSVLAATLTIVFEGLLAFVGPDVGGATQKTHVVIMSAKHHYAQLTLTEPGSKAKSIDLKEDDRITLSIGPGVATTDASFGDRVPTLSDYIHSGDVDTTVKGQKPVKDIVLGYLELPNGKLTATGALDHPAQFTKKDGTKDVRCPARTVLLTLPLAQPLDPIVITIAGNPPRRPLTRTVDVAYPIMIENVATRPGTHFKHFEGLLTFGGKLGFAGEITSQDCQSDGTVLDKRTTAKRRREAAKRRDVHHHNIQDDRAPNGDCGPVDYP